MSAAEKARKLMDLTNFAVYWDTQLLGELEGTDLVVCGLRPCPTKHLNYTIGCSDDGQVLGTCFNGPYDLQY